MAKQRKSTASVDRSGDGFISIMTKVPVDVSKFIDEKRGKMKKGEYASMLITQGLKHDTYVTALAEQRDLVNSCRKAATKLTEDKLELEAEFKAREEQLNNRVEKLKEANMNLEAERDAAEIAHENIKNHWLVRLFRI